MDRRNVLRSLLAIPAWILGGRIQAADIGSPIPDPTAKPKPSPVLTPTTYRHPVGHTHTCANGHTWDHALNPTHTCQQCGRSQYFHDQPARLVPVVSAPPLPQNPVQYQLSNPGSSGGCATGNCPLPTRRFR